MGRARGGFAAFASAAKSEAEPGEAAQPTSQESAPAARPKSARPHRELSVEEAKALLESLRTASMRPDFQKALESLRARDWGAFKKRQGFARILATAWKGAMKASGFSIDGHGFPQLLAAVRERQPEVRTISEEVERHLKFPLGALFGAKAGQMKVSAAAAKLARGAFSKTAAVSQQGPQEHPPAEEEPPALRRPMNMGEAKEMLKAFKEIVKSKEVQDTLANLERQGAEHVAKMLPLLIGQLFNPTMESFDYPLTAAAYQEMCRGIKKHGWNIHVKSAAHEVERLLHMPLGSFFFIPPDEGEEEASKVEAAAKAPQKAEPSKGEFELLVKHAVEGTELKVVLPEDATFQDAKQAVSKRTGRDDILKRGRLVQKRGGTYTSYRDTDQIKDIRQVLVLGADISTEDPGEEAEPPPPIHPHARPPEPAQQDRPPPVHPFAGGREPAAAPQPAPAPAPAKPEPPPPPTLTLQQALNMQKELKAGFSGEAFQRKRKELEKSQERGLKFNRERTQLFLSVQSVVLPRYGFQGNPKGVFDMVQVFKRFDGNEQIAMGGWEINVLLGLVEQPAAPPPPSQQPQAPEPPPQPQPQPPPPPPPPPEPKPQPPPPPEPEKAPELCQVTVEHALEEDSRMTVTIMDNASVLDLRKCIAERVGSKLTPIKIVNRVGNGFSTVPDDRKLKDKRSFLLLGCSLPRQDEDRELVVHIDYSLGMKTSVRLKPGTTIWQIKELLAQADSSGGTKPQDIGLRRLEAGPEGPPLDDAEQLADDVRELHYCAPPGQWQEDAWPGDAAQASDAWHADEVNVAGRWKMTHFHTGELAYYVFVQEPGSNSFHGWQEGWAPLSGSIHGSSIEWHIDKCHVTAKLQDNGLWMTDVLASLGDAKWGPYYGEREQDQAPAEEHAEPKEDIDVVVFIDRALDLQTSLKVRHGATTGEIKQQLASEDPTGKTDPKDIGLSWGDGQEIDDATPITTPCELDIVMRNL